MITINSLSFDGTLRKTWTAEILEASDNLLVAKGAFDREIRHSHLNVIRRGTLSYEYFWLDRWYNVFRFHEPDGAFRNYYCNVTLPPVVRGAVLDYVDLDIDIIVDAAGNLSILDEDEFCENGVRFGYTDELKAKAAEAVGELTELIKSREFPFDHPESLEPKAAGFVIESSGLDQQ